MLKKITNLILDYYLSYSIIFYIFIFLNSNLPLFPDIEATRLLVCAFNRYEDHRSSDAV